MKAGEYFGRDISLWSLMFWNLVAIAWAVMARWSLAAVMAVYWCQSLILGFFWFLRIAILSDFYDPQSKDMSMEEAVDAKTGAAVLFIVTYVIIHVFAGFLLYERLGPVRAPGVLIVAGIFFVSQCLTFSRTATWISGDRPTSSIVVFPYIRVIPMFVPLLVMAGTHTIETAPLVMFLLAKALADGIMHVIERSHFGESSYLERTFRDFERKEGKGTSECDFCGRAIEEFENVRHIKDHVVCLVCWKAIQKEKDEAGQR